MNPGMNGINAGPGRNGAGAVRSPSSAIGGAVPKVKLRKKIPTYPVSQPPQYLQLSHQAHPTGLPQQLIPHVHQHLPSNGHLQSNIAPSNSNGSSQPICKNIPKNQLLFDWQSGEGPLSSRRICRNRHTSLDLYDSASDESVSQDNRHSIPTNSHRGALLEVNGSIDTLQPSLHFHRLRMNGQDTGSGSPSEVSSHSMVLNNGTGRHSESSQQSAIDNKKINVPSSPDRAHVEHRLNQIQDYIKQTSSLIESYRLSEVENSEVSCAESTVRPSQHQEPQVNEISIPLNGATSTAKSTDLKKQTEIKIKFEESLKQLHALQAEQAILIQKRSEAQEQLQGAQRARNMLLAMSANGGPVNAQVDGAAEDRPTDNSVNNLQDLDRQLSALRSKNQAESHQSLPSRESSHRKRQPTEASDVTTYLKELLTGEEIKEQASSEDSAVEDAMDEYAEARAQVRLQGQIVQDKVSEINALRAQLDQAKSLLNLAHQRRDARFQQSATNSADEAVADQAVNIQRQRRGDGESAPSNHVESRKNKTSSKQQLLDQERAKLGRLRALLATVQEYRSSGLPIPEHILSEFSIEGNLAGSRCTSPAHTAGSLKGPLEEDAAAEADVEEDDEPESSTQWNQQRLSLIESAAMASELSQGLQNRAAQLQVERDGLAAMQRQLDGLFTQLHQQHQAAENKSEPSNVAASNASNASNASSVHATSPAPSGSRNAQDSKRADEVTQRRMEILTDLHSRWQQLQEEIALDGELNVKATPVLTAAKSALNLLTAHILPETECEDDNPEELVWEQRSLRSRGQATPTRTEPTPHTPSRDRQTYQGGQMFSAPSTLLRKKSATDVDRNQRAVWSMVNAEDHPGSSNDISDSMVYNAAQLEENRPIVSMPSPSPIALHQQTQEMKNRIAALSLSCQSLGMDSLEGINPNPSPSLPLLPLMPALPPPPPPHGSSSHDREAYYQQLLAAGQLQQHQVLLTAVNQCFHILKMQQNQLVNLSDSIHMLTSGASHGVHPHPGLLQNEEQWSNPSQHPAHVQHPGPGPPTLNNQVPPGNRTNNYWDNFRSYSRQNLLSTSAKSNEGLPHSPSPLVERSHNSLRSSTPMSVPGPSSAMPQFHSLPTHPCLPGGPGAAGADSASAPVGAVGPVPPASMDFSHTSPLVQNIPRKDKRNIDNIDGGQGSPRRRASNEIDHRTASRVLEDAALPLNSQMLSPTTQDFDVPSMPILRNSMASLQSRLNQVNLNAPPSLPNLQEFMEMPNPRQQLNNEGVPFSEISTSLSNHQINEFGGFCSFDHAREGSRRLNMDYHNGTTEAEPSSSTVLKRNTGAIKRTYSTAPNTVNSVNNPSGFTPHYQRNIHSSSAIPHLPLSNSASNTENPETVFKSSKQQSSHDASRNFNFVGRRPTFQEDFQVSCPSSTSSRSRIHGINETDDHHVFHHDEDTEYEDIPMLRSTGFNNCQGPTVSLSSTSQNTSNTEIPNLGPGKNQLKESCFQLRKCPKYQTKSGSRSPLSETAAVAAAAVAAVAQSSPSHRNVHRSSTKSQSANWIVNKNNQDFAVPNQMSGQGQLFEELRESVYAEMTSLISANGGKSHFLVQLLRDLQHISSESVRQSVLQLIQQAVSRYRIDVSTLDLEGCTFSLEDEAEDDEDEAKRIEMERLPYAGACSSSDLKGSVGSASSTQEGETLMQLVLGLELAAVLSANSDENCSSSLIEDIRSRILQLIPVSQSSVISNSPRSVSYLHSQVENVLESVLLKFQGLRIGDVRSEITSCVVSALPIKLMYRSMVDYYSRNNMETEAHSRRDGSFKESTVSSSSNTTGPNPHHYPLKNQDGRDIGMLAEASNGDLAEADQSHHTLSIVDGDGDSEADRDCSTEGQASESASTLLHVHVYQLSGASEVIDSEPEVEALQDEGETVPGERGGIRNDTVGAVGGVGISTVERNSQEDISESWSLEQDCDRDELEREQGLDQVPTRLACDSDRDQENGEKHRSHHLAMPPNDHSSSS